MLHRIRIAIAESPGSDWRSVIDGMRPINARLWQRLPHAERRRFLQHARWLWEACRHRMAPATSQAIEQLIEERRLKVHAARVLSVQGRGPLQVTIRDRALQREASLEADLVVQATGLDTAVAFATHDLLGGLLRDGLAIADPLQLGVLATADGQLLNRDGDSQAGLYAIGSLLRGSHWECAAMPEIRAAAHQLADLMARQSRRPRLVHSAG